ncbi:MAG: hypothetical protein Q8J69_07570 [Sphingobacteriaceae bacterium]|nr:hypothetical protein [Sphingobacteriaceae bacterium]
MENVMSIILELAQSHKSAEDWEAEIHEKQALELIAEYILQHQLHANLSWPFELPANLEDYTNDQVRYLIDSVSLTNEEVLELNWQYVHAFWPEEHESKEHFKKLLTEMIEMKDMFYNLEEEDF